MCCPRCGSATRGRGGIPITRSRACGWTVTGSSATTPGPVRWCWSGTARLHRTADRLQSGGAVVLRERNEQSAPVRWVERHPVPEGRDQRLPATRRGHGQPRAHRHQGRTALHRDGPTRRDEGDQGPAVGVPHPALDTDPSGLETAPIDLTSAFDAVAAARKAEADEFYASVIPADHPADEALVARQAFAGLLWGKQFFHYDVKRWLAGDPGQPAPPPGRGNIRGSRPGTWRSTASRSRTSIRNSPNHNWCCCRP